MARLTIQTKKGVNTIEGEIAIYEYTDGEVFYCVSPELDLIGYDTTAELARQSFELVLHEFFDYTTKKNCLDQELIRLGWKKNGSKTVDFSGPGLELIAKSEVYADVLNQSAFHKSTKALAL